MSLDFGEMFVGSVAARPYAVPLTLALSTLPSAATFYLGGNAAIDLALQTSGLSVPVTAGSLNQRFPGLSVHYAIRSVEVDASDGGEFSASPGDCGAATADTCTASVSFAPKVAGQRTARLRFMVDQVVALNAGALGALAQVLSSLLAPQIENLLATDVVGVGVVRFDAGSPAPAPSGSSGSAPPENASNADPSATLPRRLLLDRSLVEELRRRGTSPTEPLGTIIRRELRVPEEQVAVDVDAQTYAFLLNHANEIGESPSSIIQRLLNLPSP